MRRKIRTPIKKVPDEFIKATPENNVQFLPENPLEHLDDEYRQLLERVVTYQDQYELPSDDDVKKITVSTVFFLKIVMESALWIFRGNSFHNLAAEVPKSRFPNRMDLFRMAQVMYMQ